MREMFLLSIVMLGMEVYATGKALYASETQKFHVVFDRRPAASSHLRSKAFDASDVTLLRFETHGATYGGLDSVLAEDIKVMVVGFAVNVAHTVRGWSKGDLPE